jgi:hypothetical protein
MVLVCLTAQESRDLDAVLLWISFLTGLWGRRTLLALHWWLLTRRLARSCGAWLCLTFLRSCHTVNQRVDTETWAFTLNC